jgi:exodeoxyribonuclease-5
MPATTLQLSPEQKTAHDAIIAFVKKKKPELKIGGFAGCGKTTLIANTLNHLREKNKKKTIALACFTGKAAFVLKEKLRAAEALGEEYCGTIHGLMYRPVEDENGAITWIRRDTIDADLIIIDEASMVSEQIYNDLKQYGVPMLFIGDHGQLPPIGGQLALMEKPDVTLTQIQRQAAGNPIIQLSQVVRETGNVPQGCGFGDGVNSGLGWHKIDMRLHDLVKGATDPGAAMFLCGYNKTRVFLNGAIRDRLGFSKPIPMQGEKLICLKNNREIGIFNGMGGLLKKIDWPEGKHSANAEIQMEDGTTFNGSVIKAQFGADVTLRELKGLDPRGLKELFDWGYALTVHKAQGSEADRVFLIEERFSQMDDETWRRWLYTGVTRARKHLTVVSRIRS